MANVGSSSSAPIRPAVMMRGTVAQRPWAATLAAIGIGGRSGQLTLRGGGKVYRIAFSNGIVVGATSPIAADSVSRIALAHRMISPVQAQQIARMLGKARADDVERFADATGLGADQMRLLKRRVLIARTARTFGVDDGEYTIDDRIGIPVLLGVEVDIRAAIYHGCRKHQSTDRMVADLRALGNRFALRPEAEAHLPRFELGEAESPVIDALHHSTTLPELEATHRELDPRMVLAVMVSLASCDAIVPAELTSRVPTPQNMSLANFEIRIETTMTRVPTPREPTMSCVPMLINDEPNVQSVRPIPARPVKKQRAPTMPRAMTYRAVTDPFIEAQATTQRPSPLSFAQVKRLIQARAALLGKGVDHFEFLGIPFDAPIAEVRAAYVELARYLRPEKLKELGFADEHHDARSVFAQVVIAYTVLTDPARRADYVRTVRPRRR
ncbi:MAG: DnaJ domain-containing protein [Deltaproteobacteria bacterium]|nr:DnaJ domain-containing protein [Deltaproteobacteria bacterium]